VGIENVIPDAFVPLAALMAPKQVAVLVVLDRAQERHTRHDEWALLRCEENGTANDDVICVLHLSSFVNDRTPKGGGF
jgi:hypothetical protein